MRHLLFLPTLILIAATVASFFFDGSWVGTKNDIYSSAYLVPGGIYVSGFAGLISPSKAPGFELFRKLPHTEVEIHFNPSGFPIAREKAPWWKSLFSIPKFSAYSRPILMRSVSALVPFWLLLFITLTPAILLTIKRNESRPASGEETTPK